MNHVYRLVRDRSGGVPSEYFYHRTGTYLRTALVIFMLLITQAATAEEFDLDEFERKVDATLRSACHGYVIDMLPDALAGVRNWLYEESPACKEVARLKRDAPLRDVFERLPMSRKDVVRIYDRDAWTWPSGSGEVAAQIGFSCEMEYMCMKIRRGLAQTADPVSQADYDVVAQSCADAPSPYFCIEDWFSSWPRSLPTLAAAATTDYGSRLDQLLVGADEAIDERRAIAAREQEEAEELARLDRERTTTLAAMEQETKRLIAAAERRERLAEEKRKKKNIMAMSMALAGGAALASQSGFTDAGKLDFFTKYASGVINQQDLDSFRETLGGVATEELDRQNERLKRIEAQRAQIRAAQEARQAEARRAYEEGARRSYENAIAQGRTATDPAVLARSQGGSAATMGQPNLPATASAPSTAPPAQATKSGTCSISRSGPGGATVGPPSLLEGRFLGRYVSRNSSDSYFELDADGSGTWSASFQGGGSERVPIRWVPMVDANCGAQVANNGDVKGHMLVVEYLATPSERLKKSMRFVARDLPHNTLRVGCTDDGRGCEANFGGFLNAYFIK